MENVALPSVGTAVETELSHRNDTIILIATFFEANKLKTMLKLF